jgi:hypothetical protein
MEACGSSVNGSGWARFARGGYEVSSKGDRRFSALYARLGDGRSIEEAYQLDVKGYRQAGARDWRAGKGKPPLGEISRAELWQRYLALWQQWAIENPRLMGELELRSRGRVLTDRFASSEISQARALAVILRQARRRLQQKE